MRGKYKTQKKDYGSYSKFSKKPENCYERLMDVIRLGCSEDTIEASILELRSLAKELQSC